MSEQKSEVTTRIVTMEDGSQADFGKRANLLTFVNEETNTVTFKLFTGKVINWTVPFVDGLSGFVKTVYIYGLVSKIKSSLAPVKLVDLEAVISKAIVSLDTGVITSRATSSLTLSDEQKAYAFIKSVPGGRQFSAELAHWADLDNPSVVAEVLAMWATFDKSKKNAIRRDPYFKLELATLTAQATTEVSSI